MRFLSLTVALACLAFFSSSNADDKARRRESSRSRRNKDSRNVFTEPDIRKLENGSFDEKQGEKQCAGPTTITSDFSETLSTEQGCQKFENHMQLFRAVEETKAVNGFKSIKVCPGTTSFAGDISFSKGSKVVLRCDSEGDGCFFKGKDKHTRFFQVQDGGVLNMKGFTLDSGSAVANGGSAPKYGGAVYVHEGGAFETLKCSFINNSGLLGGAIYNRGTMSVKDCHFFRNSAENAGGAAYVLNPGTASFENCVFVENSAGLSGGALQVNGVVKVEAGAGLFRGNTAVKGPNISIVSGDLRCTTSPRFCNNIGVDGPSPNCPTTVTKCIVRSA